MQNGLTANGGKYTKIQAAFSAAPLELEFIFNVDFYKYAPPFVSLSVVKLGKAGV